MWQCHHQLFPPPPATRTGLSLSPPWHHCSSLAASAVLLNKIYPWCNPGEFCVLSRTSRFLALSHMLPHSAEHQEHPPWSHPLVTDPAAWPRQPPSLVPADCTESSLHCSDPLPICSFTLPCRLCPCPHMNQDRTFPHSLMLWDR